MKRLHVFYKGRVQGVGFRFTAEAIAQEADVTGWVRNLPNGDVELVAEGEEEALNQVLGGIQRSNLGRYVSKTVTQWEKCQNEFSNFRIEFVY